MILVYPGIRCLRIHKGHTYKLVEGHFMTNVS